MEEEEVSKMIDTLNELNSKKSLLLDNISNLPLLLEALKELNNMIEMEDAKKSIVEQIKFLLVNTVFATDKGNFDGHMLHTVIYGSSGTGKSRLGVILAKIWTALGLLKNNAVNPVNTTPLHKNSSDTESDSDEDTERINELEKQIQNLIASGKYKNNVVKKLQTYCSDIKQKLKTTELQRILYLAKTLRREIPNNKLITDIISSLESAKEKVNEIVTNSISEESVGFTIVINKEEMKKEEMKKEIEAMDILIEEMKSSNVKKDSLQNTQILPNLIQNIHPLIQSMLPLSNFEAPKTFDIIRVVSREDMVGGFLGQTAMKTEKLLRDSLGKVLFIDEAYSLINDEKDSYGYECLSTLNRFMSEHSSEIVIIFAGYKDLLEQTIFKAQPGLKRRCTWNFEIRGYSERGLSKIFIKQLEDNGWLLGEDVNILSFFKENLLDFPYYGGDCQKLVFYCKIVYASHVFDKGHTNEKIINNEILYEAFKYLKTEKVEKTYNNMYI